MRQNDADRMANSVDPDQTAPAVWSGSTQFAQAYLSENLGSLWYSNLLIAFPMQIPYQKCLNAGSKVIPAISFTFSTN